MKISDQSYTVKLNTESNITVTFPSRETGTHVTPPESAEPLQEFLRTLAAMFESYSKRWFHNQVSAMAFIKRLSHIWQFESQQPYTGQLPEEGRGAITVRQTWCPEQLHILPRTIQLHWKLVSASYEVEKPSGLLSAGTLEEFSVDAVPEAGGAPAGFDLRISGVREKALRKVREARLRAAVAKWHANELIVRYYERYGTTELLDGDSELSSDDEQPPENKK